MNNNVKYFGKPPATPPPGQQQIQVDLKNATPKVCKNRIRINEFTETFCDSEYFIPVIKLYTISALVSPTGQELTAQRPVLVCQKCGAEAS